MQATAHGSLSLILLSVVCGCSYINDAAMTASNRTAAEVAWYRNRSEVAADVPLALRSHFGHGFVQGYEDVAAGGSGKVPLFPPQCYWAPKYRTGPGREKVMAWFAGYNVGVEAAFRNGAAGGSKIPTSWVPAPRLPQAQEPPPAELIPTPPQPPAHPMGEPPSFDRALEELPIEALPQLEPKSPQPPKAVPQLKAADELSLDVTHSLMWYQRSAQLASSDQVDRPLSEYLAAFDRSNHSSTATESSETVATGNSSFEIRQLPALEVENVPDREPAIGVPVQHEEPLSDKRPANRELFNKIMPAIFRSAF